MFNQIQIRWNTWRITRKAKIEYSNWCKKYPHLKEWDLESLGDPKFGADKVDEMQKCLLLLSQGGSEQALLALTSQLLPGLRTLARHYKKTTSEAEVISVFNEIIFKRDLIKRPNKIAANLILDTKNVLYRTTQRNESVQKDEIIENSCYETFSITEETYNMELMKKVIGPLENKDNELFQLATKHWLLGYSIKELAAELNISQTAATTKLWRLRNILKTNNSLKAELMAA